jgi:hypothetical protein
VNSDFVILVFVERDGESRSSFTGHLDGVLPDSTKLH